jgi:hypothetical protein
MLIANVTLGGKNSKLKRELLILIHSMTTPENADPGVICWLYNSINASRSITHPF